jgi:hypothetical protein
MFRPTHPGVIRMIKQTISAGIPTAICGEMGGDINSKIYVNKITINSPFAISGKFSMTVGYDEKKMTLLLLWMKKTSK